MTKKHFQALAEHIRRDFEGSTRHQVACSMARFCARQAPLFQRSRFLAACGVKEVN